RVVETPVGRAEVAAGITGGDRPSPPGPHTHFLPYSLELGNELPTLFALPKGWAPGAIFQPPPGWRLPG
ncbi:MAG: hypothetical protein JWL70_1140, partial [Acidimicrobiia bacterium]|nr:hypothetical protein [Acidimicrobiia bacterium]